MEISVLQSWSILEFKEGVRDTGIPLGTISGQGVCWVTFHVIARDSYLLLFSTCVISHMTGFTDLLMSRLRQKS